MNNRSLVSIACSLFCLGSLNLFAEDVEERLMTNLYGKLASFNDVSKDTSFEEDLDLLAERKKLGLSRTDQIPPERLADETDSYLEGYIQALIDAHYYEFNVIVCVKKRYAYLYNLPNDDRLSKSIIAFVCDLPDIEGVEGSQCIPPEIMENCADKHPPRKYINGVWFPESTVLFPPLVASPRDPNYSVAYRWGDVLADNIIAVSLGDTFPIFRWYDVGPCHGALQLDIAAGVWSLFDMSPANTPNGEWAELINTDYLLSIPLSYAVDNWAFRFRVYHISTHLGDEYIVNHPGVKRVNPSFEAFEFLASYQCGDWGRFYFGPGYIFHSDDSFPMEHLYLDYGLELRKFGQRCHYHRLYGTPFFAIDIQNWQFVDWRFSVNMLLGYEWSKLQGAGRKVRIYGQYHNGNNEGQFFKIRTKYWAFGLSWGF